MALSCIVSLEMQGNEQGGVQTKVGWMTDKERALIIGISSSRWCQFGRSYYRTSIVQPVTVYRIHR